VYQVARVIATLEGERSSSDPFTPIAVDLIPGRAYPFPSSAPFSLQDASDGCPSEPPPGLKGLTLLRGMLYSPEGQGLAGATVQVEERSNIYTVGADGQWVLWFRESLDEPEELTGLQTVRFDLPDSSTMMIPNVCVVRGRATYLPVTALRGWVRRDGLAVPGAQVTVGGFPSATQTDLNGAWNYYFRPDQADAEVSVTATLLDGTNATQDPIQVRRRGTVVVPAFNFSNP
jgi:hypothetical protein